MKHNRIRSYYNLIVIAAVLVMTFACSDDNEASTEVTPDGNPASVTIDSTFTTGTPEGSAEVGYDADDLIENSTFSSTVAIDFGSSVTITNPLAGAGVTVVERGGDVTITSTAKAVEYVVSGTTASGSVKIYSDNKFKLTLNGVSITNNDGPALNIQSSKRAFIVLADNTTNALTDGTTYTASGDEDMKGTIFSEGQLIFSGHGSLTVKGNYKHGVVSDDYIRVRSGSIAITSAATDGIHTNDAFIADGGTFTITASSDGIECEEGYIIINDGTFTLNTGDDGIAASYDEGDSTITPYVTINGGSITVNSTGGEGIESKSVLTINNGYIETKTTDDGLNAGTAIYINDGSVYSYSTGNDAMDSNGTFTITGGRVVAIGARSPEASFDCDARTFKITGGLVIGIGGATSGPSASASTVPSVILGSGTANQIIHIESADGKEALTFLAPTSYSTLIFASSKLTLNTAYTIYTGGSVTNGVNFFGLYYRGEYAGGKVSTTFTPGSRVTQLGGSISRG